MKSILTIFVGIVMLSALVARPLLADIVDFTTGTTGTESFNQSFNETRAVEFSVVAGDDLIVSSMTLNRFDANESPASVGARIYNSDGTLLASVDQIVPVAADQSVTIPISALLQDGQTYRAGFFLSSGASGGAGDFFDATPSGLTLTPYVDSNSLVQVLQAYALASDSFPTNLNSAVPFMTMEVQVVPEPANLALMAIGALAIALRRPSRKRRLAPEVSR